MGKTKDLGHLAHIVTYDSANHITVPAGITMHTNQLVASQSWVTTALGSYALSTSLGSYVPTSRTITINGTTLDLSGNISFTIAAGLTSFNTRTGAITLTSSDVTTALGFTPYNATNPSGYITGITSLMVTTALGFTPYNSTNPAGYITGISFANVSAKPTTLSGYGITDAVPSARTITINGTALDLSANRSWTITATETDTLATVTARGASTNSVVDFGPDSGNNNGIGIRYANDGYGRIRFYNAGTNHSTIHSFGSTWDGGGIAKSQNCINVDGGTGVTIGAWNNPDMYVNKSGTIWARTNLNTLQVNFRNSSNNAFFTGNSDWGVRLANDNGYIQFGPANSSWTHIYSDKNFYFNQNLYVNGTQVVTNSGTWGINISGSAGSAPANGGNSSTVGGLSPVQFFNNMGQVHGTYTNFNSYGDFGARYMQGSANGPGTGSTQYYGFTLGLGSEYSNYGSQFYWNRTATGGNPYVSVRFLENGSWGGWSRIYAGYADSAGSASSASSASSAGSLSANATANNIYNSGWFRNYGDSGLYNQDYGCHIVRNGQSSHGAWSMFGYTKAGYIGMNLQDPSGYNNNLMYEGGNGGMYTENANGWQWYYNRGSNCIGLGGSTTYNWVRAVVNGKLKIESDSIHTGWAYFDSNLQLAGGGNTLYNEYNLWYVWRNWGGWGGEWINRNGGDMIMNLYAVYSVTGSISDIRYKKDVTALSYGLNEIMQLNPIKYHYNLPKESMLANDPDYFLGFSAQEVQALIPEAVHEKMGSDNKDGMLAITYDELIPVLVNGMKEQQVMIHNQNIKINKLEALVNQLLNN